MREARCPEVVVIVVVVEGLLAVSRWMSLSAK
jgi:hypothetical protein